MKEHSFENRSPSALGRMDIAKRANDDVSELVPAFAKICNSTANTLLMTPRDYAARDRYLHGGQPIYGGGQYKDWARDIQRFERTYPPHIAMTIVVGGITDHLQQCEVCGCEMDENGDLTGMLIGAEINDSDCDEEAADDCNIYYGCTCILEVNDMKRGRRGKAGERVLRIDDKVHQGTQRTKWAVPGPQEPYYLEGQGLPERGASYLDYLALEGVNLAALNSVGPSRYRSGRPSKGSVFGFSKRNVDEDRFSPVPASSKDGDKQGKKQTSEGGDSHA
ncbi:hypothetical protein TWF730_002949 [Orbilia blumenaviensis]|uniref:Uncharacterized protein n=1 Tax=Orbilia blumenaviensis TaxID=1796055 RepID=A0AAV9UAJ5_9PEZI